MVTGPYCPLSPRRHEYASVRRMHGNVHKSMYIERVG
jgi:hypothetical protein